MDIGAWLLNQIYPPRCPVCDDLITPKGGLLCRECRESLTLARGLHCVRCGKFIRDPEQEYCEDCRRIHHYFDEGYGIFPYRDWARESLGRMKYHGRREYGAFYGQMLAQGAAEQLARWKPQVILPVPMHPKKQRQRGYNQAQVLAEALGERIGLPVRTDLLRRIHPTSPQKELDRRLRRQNLRKAFAVFGEVDGFERVLLVDDIYTTGSTVDAAAQVLTEAGVKAVYVLTVCTGSE